MVPGHSYCPSPFPMKKLLLSLGLALGITSAAQAQIEIGLRISPSLAYGRFTDTKDLKFENDGSRPHFSGGLVIDYFFGENYAFSTGLDLAARGGNVKTTATITDPLTGLSVTGAYTSKLGLQYLMLPLSLKLFTNEIAPDTRLYAQVGGEVGALLGAKFDGKKTDADGNKYSKEINTLDAAAVIALGAELTMGKSTKVFGDISYHHGLVNIADKKFFTGATGAADAQIKNNSIALDLGLKF